MFLVRHEPEILVGCGSWRLIGILHNNRKVNSSAPIKFHVNNLNLCNWTPLIDIHD